MGGMGGVGKVGKIEIEGNGEKIWQESISSVDGVDGVQLNKDGVPGGGGGVSDRRIGSDLVGMVVFIFFHLNLRQ